MKIIADLPTLQHLSAILNFKFVTSLSRKNPNPTRFRLDMINEGGGGAFNDEKHMKAIYTSQLSIIYNNEKYFVCYYLMLYL